MEITKGVTLDYNEGALVLKAEVAGMAVPVLEGLKAKVESGEIDPIKGTDLDKLTILQVIEALKSALVK